MEVASSKKNTEFQCYEAQAHTMCNKYGKYGLYSRIVEVESRHQPVMDGNVALFPLTLRCRLDLSSPPSTTSHFTESSVFDFTRNDIIPPNQQNRSINNDLIHLNRVKTYGKKYIIPISFNRYSLHTYDIKHTSG